MTENSPNAIHLPDLKQAIDAIFLHMTEVLNIDHVPLDQDYYLNIPRQLLYEAGDHCPPLEVGSLFEDLDFINKVSRNKEDAVSLMLVHVAPLLRYLAYKVGQ
ncbi:hypothetical protein ACLB1G_12585 [Oxalobacteraceae bacterium A2-2]